MVNLAGKLLSKIFWPVSRAQLNSPETSLTTRDLGPSESYVSSASPPAASVPEVEPKAPERVRTSETQETVEVKERAKGLSLNAPLVELESPAVTTKPAKTFEERLRDAERRRNDEDFQQGVIPFKDYWVKRNRLSLDEEPASKLEALQKAWKDSRLPSHRGTEVHITPYRVILEGQLASVRTPEENFEEFVGFLDRGEVSGFALTESLTAPAKGPLTRKVYTLLFKEFGQLSDEECQVMYRRIDHDRTRFKDYPETNFLEGEANAYPELPSFLDQLKNGKIDRENYYTLRDPAGRLTAEDKLAEDVLLRRAGILGA